MQEAPFLFPTVRDGELSVVRVSDISGWPSLEEACRNHRVRQPLLFIEPTLQLEPFFQIACQNLGFPAIMGTVYNVPLAVELIERFQPDAVVTTDKALALLNREWGSKKREVSFPRLIFCIDGKEENETVSIPNPIEVSS